MKFGTNIEIIIDRNDNSHKIKIRKENRTGENGQSDADADMSDLNEKGIEIENQKDEEGTSEETPTFYPSPKFP